MSQVTLESLSERVAALEKIISEMRQSPLKPPRAKDWRRTIGMFAGDEVMKEIFDAARQIREDNRQEAAE